MERMLKELKFDERGLLPAVVMDDRTGEVLMLAYVNAESLEKTVETGKMHYWSRSRNKLWLKGEISGHFQHVKSMRLDCDGDTLLVRVDQEGVACHTGNKSCFYRELTEEGAVEVEDTHRGGLSGVLQEVYDVIVDRTVHPKEGSYTNYLFEKGIDKMLKKVGEETSEVIIAAKNNSKDELRYEISDLMYHLLVVMVERGLKLEDVYNELKGRR